MKTKILKWLRGAAIAAVGAVLAYLTAEVIPNLEMSGASALWVAVLSSGVNAIKLVLQKVDDSDG